MSDPASDPGHGPTAKAPAPEGAAGSRRTQRPSPMLLIGLLSGIFGAAFESIAVATAMPSAARDLQADGFYAWAFTLFIVGQLCGTAFGGRYADRFGPVRPITAGLITFAVGLCVAGLAQSWIQLVAGRLIQGVGAGGLFVGLMVVIARLFDDAVRARVMTFVSAAWIVPAFVGPPIAGWLTEQWSWHWVFFAVLPLLVLAGLLVVPVIMRARASGALDGAHSGTFPVPPWAPIAAAAGAIVLQASGQLFAAQSPRWQVAALIIIGVVLLGLALLRLMPAGFTRIARGLPSVIWVRLLCPGAFFGTEAFLPLMLVDTRQLSYTLAGVVLTVGALGWAAGSWAQSQPWMRLRRDQLIGLGTVTVTLGIAVASLPAWLPWLWFGLVGIGWLIGGFGMGLVVPSTSLVVMSLSPPAQQGRNSASLQIAEGIGWSLLVGLAGSLFAALRPSDNLSLTFGMVITVMAVVAAISMIFVGRIGPVRQRPVG